MTEKLKKAAGLISNAKHCIAFTGAGISVESGIPPFRGEGGLWSEYDPVILDLDNYQKNSEECWPHIKRLFYDFFGTAHPNPAHKVLAEWEAKGVIKAIITQNIDNLHQEAGSSNVLEFHGTSQRFICPDCGAVYKTSELKLGSRVPLCVKCNSLLKPDFIFFGEGIPEPAGSLSFQEAKNSDVFIVIGTSGEVMPASYIPFEARQKGAKIVEINKEESAFTHKISDVFIQGEAGLILKEINNIIRY